MAIAVQSKMRKPEITSLPPSVSPGMFIAAQRKIRKLEITSLPPSTTLPPPLSPGMIIAVQTKMMRKLEINFSPPPPHPPTPQKKPKTNKTKTTTTTTNNFPLSRFPFPGMVIFVQMRWCAKLLFLLPLPPFPFPGKNTTGKLMERILARKLARDLERRNVYFPQTKEDTSLV